MKIILFVGSGISFDSGLPNAEKITDMLLKESWHTDVANNFYSDEQANAKISPFNIAPRLQSFLTILKESADNYLRLRMNPKSTYEDLFFLCQQIFDDQNGEIENPAIEPFIRELRHKTQELCSPIPFREEVNLRFLAKSSLNFIQCVVWQVLLNPTELIGLNLIIELAKKQSIEMLDIATLNHDLLIEKFLKENRMQFNDGFDPVDEKIRYFNPELYDKDDVKINIFKLHGSINWYRFKIVRNGIIEKRYGTTSHDYQSFLNLSEYPITIQDHKPVFLSGSYNKIFEYDFGIFSKIHDKFFSHLSQHKIMIMSGYGWNDRGMNKRLLDWIESSRQNRLILLHRNPELEIKRNSRSEMWDYYDDLMKKGQLVTIKKWLSETSLQDIETIVPEFCIT